MPMRAGSPSGPLTFLFTDLEGSTRLWEEEPEAMSAALGRHDAILRQAIEAGGGRVFATMGDGLAAVFDRPGEAIGAALAAQLALAAEPWGATGPLRVRMGLHTGPARRVGDDYLGPSLNRCARLMGIAHGGQVLVSGATAEVVGGALPAAAGLDDKGRHRLRDLSEAERVFQLVHPSLPDEFPPLRSLDAFPGNLPKQLTSFLGRDHEVARVSEALEATRLVTLVGAGGVGKTRLALHVGAETLPRFPDGAWVCELAPIGDPQAVGHALATVLSVSQIPGTTVVESLVEALRGRHLLVILDSCEHLLEPVADVVDALVHRCPRVTVLATSREALAVDGEHVWPLRPLDLPKVGSEENLGRVEGSAAVRLFVDRARAVRPAFLLSEGNAAAVADICRRLDGVPLAIELAAARITTLSPGDLLRRLDDRFRLLTGGRRTALERHRTLRGTVEWSYDLLAPAERRLFDRFAVFAGGCGLEAIEAICTGNGVEPGEIVDRLDRLVGKSLVVAEETEGSMRYTMLETLRQYGEERLRQSGDADAAGGRHAHYFAALAEAAGAGLEGAEETRWVRRLDQEFDNLRAAHAWAMATGDAHLALTLAAPLYPYAHYHLRPEVCSWAEAAIGLDSADTHPLLPAACAMASRLARLRGDFVSSRRLVDRALEAERRLGLPPGYSARNELAGTINFSSGPEAAVECFEPCVALARDRGTPYMLTMTLMVYALGLSFANAAPRAVPIAEEALRLSRQLRNPTATAFALYALGEALMESDPERALGVLEEAAALGPPFVVGVALTSSTSLRGRIAEPSEALTGYRDLVGRWQRAGNWPQQWIMLRNLLELFARLGSPQAAAVLYGAVEVSPMPPPRSGPEAERLTQALSRVRAALGTERTSVAIERGRAMTGDDLVAYAVSEIDKLLNTTAPSPGTPQGG